ncbi:hypothetical protein, partial [Zooshikella sp. RANM57]|uniref:hypothetical protein n=1 Tax=Zooshikella sp. RANM57 TaxID=3425863 RepID=UPI003D6EB2E4
MNDGADDVPPQLENIGFYLTFHPMQNAILFMLYDKRKVNESGNNHYQQTDYNDVQNGVPYYYGGFINARMELTPADPATATTMDDMFGLFYNNLNTSNDNKVI